MNVLRNLSVVRLHNNATVVSREVEVAVEVEVVAVLMLLKSRRVLPRRILSTSSSLFQSLVSSSASNHLSDSLLSVGCVFFAF